MYKEMVGTEERYQIELPSREVPDILTRSHPSGLTFSFSDLAVFLENEYMVGITAVGNSGTVYALKKGEHYDGLRFWKALDHIYGELDLAIKERDVNKYIATIENTLMEAKEYGVEYIRR